MTALSKKRDKILTQILRFCIKTMSYNNVSESAILELLKKKATDRLEQAVIGGCTYSGLAQEVLLQLDPKLIFWVIYRTGRLPSIRPNENEALVKSIDWFQSHFLQFNPSKPDQDLEDNLVAWIYGNLKRRIWDMRHGRSDDSRNRQREVSLRSPNNAEEENSGATIEVIDENREIVSRTYQPRNIILESLEKRDQNDNIRRILELEKDSLQQILFDQRPECNAYVILYRLYYGGEMLKEIAASFGVRPGSISNFLTRNVYPKLGKDLLRAYEPANIKDVVSKDSARLLRDCFPRRMPEANAQYLSMQFLTAFQVPPRSTTDVASELVNTYNYRLSSDDLGKFWEEKGLKSLVKALRVANGDSA